jgi:glutamate dehydrogenase/leucine dehydrogenase
VGARFDALALDRRGVYQRLEGLVNNVCTKVFEVADRQKLTIRLSAMSIAVDRLVEARRLRGLYP